MFRHILRVWPVLFLLVLAAFALVALPSAHACKFWAMVSQSGVQTDSVLYNSSLDTFLTLAISPPPPNTNSPNGWAAVWYHSDVSRVETVEVYREAPPVSFETFAPIRAEILTDSSYAGVAHARRSTTGPANVPDPHPFVYTGSSALFGRSYTFAHNGTVNNSAVIEDSLGTGFISLALFQDSARAYTSWNAGSNNRNDSEYYMMLLMEYQLVANNYYLTLPAGIDSPTEWMINQTVNKIVSSSSYTSLNAVLTDGESLWLLYRKPAPLDNTHFVSYYSVPDNPGHRLAMTTLNPLGNGWTALTNSSHGTYGKYVCLKPNVDATIETFQSSLMAMPNEIRVNDAVSLAQQHPAISANPLDGSFVAVWETADGSRIKGKWFNQMGMAERGEFFADEAVGGVKSAPATAHDPVTGDMTVVWLETADGLTVIKARHFTWDLAARAWNGALERVVNDDNINPVSTPKVVFDPSGNCLITWSKSLGAESEIWCEISLSGSQALPDFRVSPDDAYAYLTPDACYAGRQRIAIAYARSAGQSNSRGVYVSLVETGTQNVSAPKTVETLSNANDPAATLPSIDRLTDSTFAVGYWKQSASNLLAKRCFHAASMSSNLTIQQTYTLTGITAQPYVQLGARNDGRFYLCYQKQLSGSYEIYTALSRNKNFGTPELINTTTAGNQIWPAIALALQYDDSYLAHSYTDVFAQRRLVIWQSENQDGSDWGIVARMHGVVADSKYPWYAADRYNESVDGLLATPAPELIPVNEVVARWALDGMHLTWPALDPGSTGQRSFFYVIYASLDYDGEYVEVDAVSEPHWMDRQAAISDRPKCFYRVFTVAATQLPRTPQTE